MWPASLCVESGSGSLATPRGCNAEDALGGWTGFCKSVEQRFSPWRKKKHTHHTLQRERVRFVCGVSERCARTSTGTSLAARIWPCSTRVPQRRCATFEAVSPRKISRWVGRNLLVSNGCSSLSHPPARGRERSQQGRTPSASKGERDGVLQECGATFHTPGANRSIRTTP